MRPLLLMAAYVTRSRIHVDRIASAWAIRGFTDPALRRMAAIIRAADLLELVEEAPAEAAGVRALFDGLRDLDLTDEERLERGFPVCDGLFAYCSSSGIASGRQAR